MTQQERELLKGLTDRINGTSLASRDEDAERTLQTALGSNPNALYILCQTVLVQQFAMDNAQRQLTEARAELETLRQQTKPQEHGSFLGNLFGLGKSDDAQPSGARQVQPLPTGSGYEPVHNPGAPPAGYTPAQPPYGGAVPQVPYGSNAGYGYGGSPMGGVFGGGGGFLQGAMQTAAGVVAGEFAFRALEDVFHGFGGGEGRSFSGGTEVGNNYYNDGGNQDGDGSFGDRLRDADGLSNSLSPNIEDRRGESQGFLNGGGGDGFIGADDTGSSDDGSFNDTGFDDGYTDSGGDDGNGF